MKLISQNTQVDVSGIRDRNEFKIAASAKAFKILAAGYTNKVRAFLREVGCNALDAHVMNGFQGQFQVKLPSRLDLNCSIRDFGPGLSVEDVKGLYSTLFESTKTESNAFIGSMGLGSKSPFAYTDQFPVISRHEGMKHEFILYKDSEGFPCTSLLSSTPTDEPSGLEVILPVEHDDMYDFIREAAYVYSWFDNPPEILNCPDFKLNKREYVYETDEFIVTGSLGLFGVLMGNIFYPIDRTSLGSNNEHLLQGYSFNIILKMPNGLCDYTASRESLSFDPTTRKNVKDYFERAMEHLTTMGAELFGSMDHTDLEYVKAGRLQKMGYPPIYELIKSHFEKQRLGVTWDFLTREASTYGAAMIAKNHKHAFHIQKYGMSIRKQNVDKDVTFRNALFSGVYVGERHDIEKVRRHMFHNKVQDGILVTREYWREVLCRRDHAIFVDQLPVQPPRDKTERKAVVKRGDNVFYTEHFDLFKHNKIRVSPPLVDVADIKGRVPLVKKDGRSVDENFDMKTVKNIAVIFGSKGIAICSPTVYDKFLELYSDVFYNPLVEIEKVRQDRGAKSFKRHRALMKFISAHDSSIDIARRFGLTEVEDLVATLSTNYMLKFLDPLYSNAELYDYRFQQSVNRMIRPFKRVFLRTFEKAKSSLPPIERYLMENPECDDNLRDIIETMRNDRLAKESEDNVVKLRVA